MGKSKNYLKISTANTIKAILLSALPVSVWVGIFIIKEGELYQIINFFIILFLCILVYCLADLERRRIIFGKCDFKVQEAFVLKLLNRKGNIRHVRLHLELLYISLILGRYDRVSQEMEILHRSVDRLNSRQRLQLQLLRIDYGISINERLLGTGELENAERALEKSNGLTKGTREKIRAGIRLRRYFIEEKWRAALELLCAESGSGNTTVYQQVNMAYMKGKCYWQLGRYEEAYSELNFAAVHGGNTKYVALAKTLIEEMPDKNIYNSKCRKIQKKKHYTDRRVLFLAADCFMVLLLCGAALYCSYGNSIEEAYGRRYLCGESKPFVVYAESVGEYKLAILNEGDKLGYCILRKNSNSGYRIIDSYRIDQYTEKSVANGMDKFEKGVPEWMEEFYQESSMRLDVWEVITEFYKKNKIFYQDNVECVGISYSPMVENVTVNGVPLCIEEMTDEYGKTGYLWKIKPDLRKNIRVDYMKK